jgi:hypothetical protein
LVSNKIGLLKKLPVIRRQADVFFDLVVDQNCDRVYILQLTQSSDAPRKLGSFFKDKKVLVVSDHVNSSRFF